MNNICVSYGDGIGPEIMDATLKILRAANFQFNADEILLGEQAYAAGYLNGVEDSAWGKISKNKVLLKAPLTTPEGGGFKSANVTIRKTYGLYANVRPCVSYSPLIHGAQKLDIVIIRENEEDLYSGIEHRQTDDVYQCLKIVSIPGCQKIVRFAFDYAVRNHRQKITCLTKDNIMKMTDGLFHNIFKEVAQEYPQIQAEHLIVDIGTARVATKPERFDVILAPNLYGDIISDVVAEAAGSIGLAPSANIGEHCAMFEAVHGSAPDIAGKNIANPSALLLSSVMMLSYLGENEIASNIHNAWLKAIEDGCGTGDISDAKMSTGEFAEAVVARLGKQPTSFKVKKYAKTDGGFTYQYHRKPTIKSLVGVDVFLNESELTSEQIAEKLNTICDDGVSLSVITNRGVKVWPDQNPFTFCTDHWRCRFMFKNDGRNFGHILEILKKIHDQNLNVIKSEHLYQFDGVNGFSQVQGQ